MEVICQEIDNVSIGPTITVFVAQLNVNFGAQGFLNSSFSIKQFQETLEAFHRRQGDLLVFPEYYLPVDWLPEVRRIVGRTNECNKIYIIPLSELHVPQLARIQETGVVSEGIPEDIHGRYMYLNLALILVKQREGDLSIFSQFKTLPAIQETKPHRETRRAKHLYVFKIGQAFSFAVPICFSLIGKEYDDTSNLEPLVPYIKEGRVDCLFVPQWNPKPLHWTFIKAINHISSVSNGSTSIFMANVANGIGRSSIVDLFTKSVLTSEYDIQDLQHPRCKHLIFVSTSERLFRYRYRPARLRKDSLSPEFVREVDVDVFSYDESRGKWLVVRPEIIYEYKPTARYQHVRFSPELLELRRRLSDVGYPLDRICAIAKQSHLASIDNWEGLIEHVLGLTKAALMADTLLKPVDLVWILKLAGEYHELRRCPLGAYYLYDAMNRIANRIPSRPAVLVSDYLLMRICSRFQDRRMQDFALNKAREFQELASDTSEPLGDLGLLLPTVLIESSLIISCFNNTYTDMYRYGSYSGAVQSIEYNATEPGKQRLVDKLLAEARRQIETCGLNETSPQYLHYLDVSCLTSLTFGRAEDADRFVQLMRKLDPRRQGNYGQYLASKHNEGLMLQICDDKEEAERRYLELLQEQREHNGSSNPITVRNLALLLDDEEVARYLLDVTDYGNPQHVHKDISLRKAVRVYQLGKQAVKRMSR